MGGWRADDIPSQAGRSFVVTGANSGLGYVTALELARHGARVVMAVRNVEKGEAAAETIRREVGGANVGGANVGGANVGGANGVKVGGANVEVRALDLADLDSVARFAEGIETVDVLVNNAGIMMPPRSLTKDGFESQIGSNHFGHFALTAHLFPKLNRSGGRIVTVSSDMHRMGKIDFDDLDGARSYSPTTAYAQSKLANVLFGLELDRRLRAARVDVKSVLAHPGYAATNLQTASSTGIGKRIMGIGNRVLAQSMEMGALDQLFAATAPSIVGGEMIGPDGFQALRGHPTVVTPSTAGRDPVAAKRLWTISEERTRVRFVIA